MKHNLYNIIFLFLIALTAASSCKSDWLDEPVIPGNSGNSHGERVETEDRRKVMLLYIAGYNDLQSYLQKNIDDLMTGWIPRSGRRDDVLLVYSHLAKSRFDLNTPVTPVLTRIYTDNSGQVVTDTLVRYDQNTISASASQLNKVLNDVKDTFAAKSYGLIFSSHATGYLPAGYYSSPGDYVFQEKMMYSSGKRDRSPITYGTYVERVEVPGLPMTKSIGQDVAGDISYEIELDDFAKAIPMKLDYILFDACLMGGIEVAYELADKCDRIGFSQTEVLAQGFDYTTITAHLLHNRPSADPLMVCKDYFEYYNAQEDVYQSATISLVDCNRLEPLAELCQELFDRYRIGIDGINPTKVQRFYTGSHKWFYDLESIITEAGADAEDLEKLKEAIEDCILYKAHTPAFLSSLKINTFSGFSMYLPKNGSQQLDKYYRTLKWNKATGLVL